MPYIDGVRVSQEEFIARNSGTPQRLYTGPNGENPAPGPDLDEETRAPKQPKRAGTQRSKSSKATAKAAIADATGVSPESETLDTSGLDDEDES